MSESIRTLKKQIYNAKQSARDHRRSAARWDALKRSAELKATMYSMLVTQLEAEIVEKKK